jgi:hypothetical protein
MKWRLALVAASGLALATGAPVLAQQPAAVGHPGTPEKSDVHVAQLYGLVKQVHATGLEHADHAALMAQLKTIADAHAAETGADAAMTEGRVFEMAHQAVMAAEADPHVLDSLDTFWTTLHAAAGPAAHAPPPAAATKSLQDDSSWRTDPHIRSFYDLSVQMLGTGKKLDRPAYEARAREIFQAFAVARGMDPAAMQDHLKAIPGQMIQIAKQDPKVLQSFDAFVVALMGPE